MRQESNEGGNPCTRSNHDDWSARVVREVEWIEDSRKNWNLKMKIEHYNNIILVPYPGLPTIMLPSRKVRNTAINNPSESIISKSWVPVHVSHHYLSRKISMQYTCGTCTLTVCPELSCGTATLWSHPVARPRLSAFSQGLRGNSSTLNAILSSRGSTRGELHGGYKINDKVSSHWNQFTCYQEYIYSWCYQQRYMRYE